MITDNDDNNVEYDTFEEREEALEMLKMATDWSSYDYTKAEAADMSFPDFPPGGHFRPIWLSKHWNPEVGNMQARYVCDLNDIEMGYTRRLVAKYGTPMEWAWQSRDCDEYVKRIAKLDEAKAAGPDMFAQWLSYYGMIDETHFEIMREKVTGDENPFLQKLVDAYSQTLINASMEEQKQLQANRAEGMRATGELAPFMGVALEAWAGAQAAITSGAGLDTILPSLGIDEATWHAVSAEWNARMSRDTTATIATVYGQAFVGAGAGQFGAAGQATAGAMNPGGSVQGSEPPVPFEKWIEITVAQTAGDKNGEDPSAVLAKFGITPADWGTIGGWWGQHFGAHAMDLKDDYDRWTTHYEKEYGLGDGLSSEEREVQTIAEILQMASSGQGAGLVGFLKNKFPDDADDDSALDWWLSEACDKCEESGNKNAAQQIFYARFPLQEDEDDPIDAWVASEMDSMF